MKSILSPKIAQPKKTKDTVKNASIKNSIISPPYHILKLKSI